MSNEVEPDLKKALTCSGKSWFQKQVNGMFLKRRHFGPGIPPQAGGGPESAATGVMND